MASWRYREGGGSCGIARLAGGGPLKRALFLSTLLLVGCAGDAESSKDGSQGGGADDAGGTGSDAGSDGEDCGGLSADIVVDYTVGVLPFTSSFEAEATCADGAITVAWDFDDGSQDDGRSLAHTWLASGTHRVLARVTDAGGQEAMASVDITVEAPSCPETLEPVIVGTLGHAELTEASGLGVSLEDPGLLWSHNDSGDVARFFAFDTDGTDRGTWVLTDAPEGDWEDMTMGVDPDSGATRLYLGDVGDNAEERETLVIYVLDEPVVPLAGSEEVGVVDTAAWWSFELAFADGVARNGEALMMDPVTHELYVVSPEADGTVGIHRAPGPYAADTVISLEQVGSIDLLAADAEGDPFPNGADFSPQGDKVLIRTPDRAWLLNRDQAVDLEQTWAGAVCPVPLGQEARGEGIAFDGAGAGYYTVSEETSEPIWYVELVPPEQPCAGLEARVLADMEPAEVGRPVTFSVDPACVPAGVVSATWDLSDGGGASSALEPEGLWLASGVDLVTVEIVDGDGNHTTGELEVEITGASCPVPGPVETWGTVTSEEIPEASGLGHSELNPGVLWTHNDSGGEPRLFAINEAGAVVAIVNLAFEESGPRDWEDLDLGWDDTLGAPAIFVGDVGDNAVKRDYVRVLVVAEPEVDPTVEEPVELDLTEVSTLTLTYPDGAHNCETVMVDPVTGDLLLVTKSYDGDTAIFRKAAPHEDGSNTVLEHIADLEFGAAPLSGSGATTAGSFSPLGDRIGIRTYSSAYLWRRDQAEGFAETFAGEACDMEPPGEKQGEAMDFSVDGAGYLLLSEGDDQPLYYVPLDWP